MAIYKNLAQVGNSSFGDLNYGLGSDFKGLALFSSERYRDLDLRQRYYDCTQHDHKRYDFDGRVVQAGGGIQATQPLMSAEKVAYYVPLRQRRPSSPYRLGKVIVDSFTNMVFGEERFPKFRVQGDTDSQDFTQALVKAAQMPVRAVQARNLGGSMGTVGMSWAFVEGKPRVRVHNAKNLFVHKWLDRDALVPKYLSEVYLYPKDEWDNTRRRYIRNHYWYRRDWTPNADVLFEPVKYDVGKDPADTWRPDLDKSTEHNDGLTHFEWIQNLPNEDVDGVPDYDGLYDNFDTLDVLLSVITRGATLNLDPTLVILTDQMMAQKFGIKKGSDNALVLDAKSGGDAHYLELEGTSLTAGVELFNTKRRSALEVAQCVVPDPDEVAANGTSAVGMKMLFSSMLAKCGVLRSQYGTPMCRMLETMGEVARASTSATAYSYSSDADAAPEPVDRKLDLPPKIEKKPKLDDDGNPTGEHDVTETDHTPGEGGEVEAEWPPYFNPTPADQTAVVTALSTAVAAAPIMSVETATELVMLAYGRDPGEEQAKVAKEKQAQADKDAEMMKQSLAAAGGAPGAKGAPSAKGGPPGASPPGGAKPPPPGGGAGAPPKKKPPPNFG